MKAGWSVTYERFYSHDVSEDDISEPDEQGFAVKDVSLRDAVVECPYPTEANEWPIRCPRWFTQYEYNEGTHEYYLEGIRENRSLHIPDHITPSSRIRLARLLGVLK